MNSVFADAFINYFYYIFLCIIVVEMYLDLQMRYLLLVTLAKFKLAVVAELNFV